MSKKGKFDLKHLVTEGLLKEGQKLCFVSDPTKFCTIVRHPSGEYKVRVGSEEKLTTVHAFAQTCLGMEPPQHASKWLRTDDASGGKTLYDLWQGDVTAQAA